MVAARPSSTGAAPRRYTAAIFWVLWAIGSVESLNDNPLLLLVSLDGFRYDLLNSTIVPNIWKFAFEGVHFQGGSRPQYLSYAAPNHASIATGLLVESHGIVGNFFHDLATNTTFDIFNSSQKEGVVNASLLGHFYNGEPIWLTNERAGNGRRSASMYWPTGSSHWPSPPHKPTFHKPWLDYKNLSQWMADFDEVIQLFTSEEQPFNFVAWYVSEPDHVLHLNGFKNGKLHETLLQLDLLFKYINDKLANNPELAKRLDIIVTADHGHAEIEGPANVLCLSEIISADGVLFGDRMIYVQNTERREQIYKALKNAIEQGHYGINLYYKQDVPQAYGYSKNDKIGDIVIVAEPGYNSRVNCSHERDASVQFHSSAHGMDPDHWTMRSILILKGPSFKQNYQVDTTANNIDLYPLMCHILGVVPAPNNGSLSNVLEVLKVSMMPQPISAKTIKLLTLIVCGLPLLIFLTFLIKLVRRKRALSAFKRNYYPLSSNSKNDVVADDPFDNYPTSEDEL